MTSDETRPGEQWRRRGGRFRRCLVPSRESLRPYLRLAFGAAVNVFLAVWLVPRMGKVRDPEYLLANFVVPALALAVPCAGLLVMVPVFLWGRDVTRLLAVGLCFLPCYVLICGVAALLN